MTDRELLEQALDVLEDIFGKNKVDVGIITALRERLTQPEQEPVAWVTGWHDGHCVIRAANPSAILPIGIALYTAPPRREWEGLNDDEVTQAMYRADAIFTGPMQFKFAKEIEAKLREKNA